jgi:Zn-dependent protease
LFIAPGAVMINGIVTKKRNGIISLAGPVANIILAVVFIIISLFVNTPLVLMALSYGIRINYFLAIFNMIPILNFDGKKVWAYNKLIYIMVISTAFLLIPIYELLLNLV